MTITIPISPEVETKLRERAAALGTDMLHYVAGLVEQSATAPTFDEILEPVRRDFAATGMTAKQIDDFGRDLIAKVRRERHARRQ